ncbi:MAG: MFS transporter [Candidatus Sumerlaeaceae bacterium]
MKSQAEAKVRVFALTWLSYASYYLGRKGFSIVKAHLSDNYGISKRELGFIDTGYLAAYSLGQFVMGFAGDRIGSRRLLALGMVAVAVCVAMFGLAKTTLLFFVFFTLNGFFQASGWPGNVKAMATWFSATERGKIMGAWSTCYQVGGLLASAVATYLFKHYGWQSAFFVPAVFIALIGILILFSMPEKQAEPEVITAPVELPDEAALASALQSKWEIYKNPVIWSLGGAYFCLKLIRYSILFWFPYYMTKVLGYAKDTAGYQSVSFEVGGVLGSIIVGWISDRYFAGRRRQIAAVMTLALAAALFSYVQLAPLSKLLNFIGMAIVGFCLFGPDTLVSAAAAQDIGGKYNVAKAAGFINGVGSIGAIFQGLVTSEVSEKFGWNALFYLFVIMAVLSSVILLLGREKTQFAPLEP